MADVAVSSLVRTLGEFLIEQIKFLQGVKDEVESLTTEWKYMLAFLKDAEEKQVESHNIKQWVSDIIVATYDAEAIIDEFIIKFEEEEVEEEEGHIACFIAWFRKCFCIYKEVAKQADLYEIGKEIKKLKDRLDVIKQNQENYKIEKIGGAGEGSSTGNDRFRELQREAPYGDDDEHVVGFEKDAKILTSELLKEMPHRCVISIVGMGGLGKTTMARKLYNNSSVRKEFDRSAWVFVSKDYNIPNLLRRIIKFFKVPTTNEELEKLEKMETEDLERHLRDFLQESRYLVVIDDVWDTNTWASLRRALPENKKRSRVIITTRNEVVAKSTHGDRKYVHQLPFLQEEESWELFCKKVFPDYDAVDDKTSRCPPSLEELAKDMVRKCRGLPLAIVVLGGLLSRKHPDEWPKLQGHIWPHVRGDDSNYVQQILALSFNDLVHHLKSCFLYLSMFPEDFEIDVGKLIRLWVAEDFIQQRGREALEETAMEYLKELIDRNLIQVSTRYWRRIERCRVHDLLRDFAIEKSKELNFLHIYDGNNYSTLSPTRCRRLASHTDGLKRFDSFYHLSNFHLRTLLLFNSEDEFAKMRELIFFYTKLRLLRVFDSSEEIRLPEEIGKLIHLRYFGLSGTKINWLPPSIGKLHALQTLEFNTGGESIMLPDEICNAKQLRHLIGHFKWPFHVKNLTNLRTLDCVEVDDRMEFNPLTDLIDLQVLYVFFNGERKGFTLDSIGRLRSLQTLSLSEINNANWFPTLQPLPHFQHLLQLKLYGKIRKLPTEMHEILPNLKYLKFPGWGMEEDPMPSLEKLPKLTILELLGCNRNKLVCTAGGFPQLEILLLTGVE